MSLYSGKAAELIEPAYSEDNTEAEAVADGANQFAFRLTSELLEGRDGENFVCSPYSVWLPLAALLNATDEANRGALLTALGAEGISVESVNQAASRMLYSLTKQDALKYDKNAHNPIRIANAVFVDHNQKLNKQFAQTFLDYYRGQAISVDFSSSSAVEAVNKWANDHTEGLIDNVIEQFDPDTVAAIANAIYFSDRWKEEFDSNRTRDDVFYGPAGETTASYMLREGSGQVYYEDDRIQAIPLRFQAGGVMYIMLPKDGDATGLLSSMDDAYFQKIREEAGDAEGKLLLPRFEIKGEAFSLKKGLENLGVPLFGQESAPLTGGLIESDTPVWLSEAIHKAVIKVEETGTTAAAVTVLVAAEGAAMTEPETDKFEMICNKPFAFILCDYTYDGGGQILFTGVVNQPE